MTTLKKHGLTLSTEENERGSNDVWVENSRGDISSIACAQGEGTLDDVYNLNNAQLTWLNSQDVQDWLDANNY